MTKYFIGYGISIILTTCAFLLVGFSHVQNIPQSSLSPLIFIVILALIQTLVQLYFFLHISFNRNNKWYVMGLLFTGLIVCIIVIGSLWIMSNLNYNMMGGMSSGEKDIYMLNQ